VSFICGELFTIPVIDDQGQVKCGYVVFTLLGAAFHISSTDGM
jgi:hypothetical protein